jgi:hypothetical protein
VNARTGLALLGITAIVVVAAVVASSRQSQQASTAASDVIMTLDVPPDMLAVGEVQLTVTLQQADGTPINNARLQVIGNMDHAGMIPVERAVEGGQDGVYTIPFEWTMGGGWIVTVTATLPDSGEPISRDFDLFVEAVSRQSIINQPPHGSAAPTPRTP